MKVEWRKVKIGDICETSLGKMLDAKKNKGKMHYYLNNVAVRWGTFDLSNLPEMCFTQDDKNRYMIKRGDVVICEGGEPGRCAIWHTFRMRVFRVSVRGGQRLFSLVLSGRRGDRFFDLLFHNRTDRCFVLRCDCVCIAACCRLCEIFSLLARACCSVDGRVDGTGCESAYSASAGPPIPYPTMPILYGIDAVQAVRRCATD